MDKTIEDNIIFLLCVPRSGSSLTTTILQNHSKVFATQEMWLLMSLYDLQNSRSAHGGSAIINRFYNGVVPKELFHDACRSFANEIYSGFLQRCGGEVVVDKSPRYYYILEFLDALYPASKRIWLIRNPLAVMASYKKLHYSKDRSLQLQRDLVSPTFNLRLADITVGYFRYANYFSKGNSYSYRLTYEKLIQHPREEIEKLCTFLSISYEEGIEKYGDFLDKPKGTMFKSMGVGDPNLFEHNQPHTKSLNLWKNILTKEEVETYCNILGANIFHTLGYSDVLLEAEKWTGTKYKADPDLEFLQLRTEQIEKITNYKWKNRYQMKFSSNTKNGKVERLNTEKISYNDRQLYEENQQMRISLQAIEERLQNSYREQEKLKGELLRIRGKINKVKTLIPFKHQIHHFFDNYILKSEEKK